MMLREGATARSACQALEAANSRVQNAYSGGVGRGPNGMQLAYIDAIEDLESILTNTFTRLSAADLLHTPRHWYIVNATPAIEPMDARPANLAVSRAYQELTERFDRLIVEFTKLAKWLEKPGPIVFLDTNVLMHCMPLDTIDWAKVLEVGKAVVPRLAVPLAVVDELDRKKFEGGTMPRERAGRAIQLLYILLAPLSRGHIATVRQLAPAKPTAKRMLRGGKRPYLRGAHSTLIGTSAYSYGPRNRSPL